MPVSATLLTEGADTTNANSYTTASISPGAGRVLVFMAVLSGTNPAPVPTPSGLGLTWTQRVADQGARTMAMYSAVTTTAPTPGAITITGTGATGCTWSVVELVANTTTPFPQSGVSQRFNTATSGTVSLGSSVTAGNATLAYFYQVNEETITPGTGYTAVGTTQTYSVPSQSGQAIFAATGNQNASASWATAANGGAVAIEVAQTATVPVSASRGTTWNVNAPTPKTVTGQIIPAGAVTIRRTFVRNYAGSLQPGTGVVTRGPRKLPAGSITPTAAAPKRTFTHLLAGSLTAAGVARKTLARKFTGSSQPGGPVSLIHTFVRTFTGTLTATGLAKKTAKAVKTGTITATGVSVRRGQKKLRGTITTTGSTLAAFFHRIYGRTGTVDLTVGTGAVTLVPYLRARCDIFLWTTADVLYDGQYQWDTTGAPARLAAVPLAPSAVVATAGHQQAIVEFAPPRDDGGRPILEYTATASTGQEGTGTASPIIVPGLVNGVPVTFIVTATNSVGESLPSEVSAPVTPHAGAPDPPTNVVLTPGNGQVSVAWTPPANTGGAAITGYQVNMSTGATYSVAGSPKVVTGLTNGVPVTATVSAVTSAGTSAPSTRSAPATPATVPGAPTLGTVTAGTGQVTVRWSAPASNGGTAVTGYTITVYAGTTSTVAKTVSAAATVTELAVTGLTNGTGYQVTVSAVNAMGTGAASARSATVTPTSPSIPVRGASSDGNSSSNTLVLSKPTGAVTGDVCVAFVAVDTFNISTVPTGWTVAGTGKADTTTFGVYYRVLTSTDSSVSSWTWKFSGADGNSGGIQAYSGIAGTVLDVTPVVTKFDTNEAQISASITPATANGMLVGCCVSDGAATITQPSGWVQDFQVTGGGRVTQQSHYQYGAPGAGSYTWKLSTPQEPGLVLLALRHS